MNTKREDILSNVLRQTRSAAELSHFSEYVLSQEDLTFLEETANEVLERMPYKGFNCAAMNAIWCAIIQDHSSIPVSLIAGSLVFGDLPIFSCYSNIPFGNEQTIINEVWDGHCWLEFRGLIADISIGRTLELEKIPFSFKEHWKHHISKEKGLTYNTPQYFESVNIYYQPCYSLTNQQIDGLIRGIQHEQGS